MPFSNSATFLTLLLLLVLLLSLSSVCSCSGFWRVLTLKLKALLRARNQSRVTPWWVTVGNGYSQRLTW